MQKWYRPGIVADGDNAVGAPYVNEGKVTAEVLRIDRAKKVRIIKFKRRKDYRSASRRQWFTEEDHWHQRGLIPALAAIE